MTNKIILCFFCLCLFSEVSFSQSSTVNPTNACIACTIAPESSAAFEVQGINKGMLSPRMTSNQRNAIISPAQGLMVYDTNTKSLWIYNGSNWIEVTGIIGPAGAAGPIGARGPVGATGQTGAAGVNGAHGADGARGERGATGATGQTGVAGADGADGAKGDQGPTGPTGFTGPQGTDGVNGADGADGDSYFTKNGSILRYPEINGKIAIGDLTTLPGNYGLYVERGILAEKTRVALEGTSKWADDAFGKQPSIEDMEKFIRAYSHLKGVPSAKELMKTGIDMAEMDATLLRQIEWLWEHTIQLNKEKKALEEKLKQQNLQLELMDKRLLQLEKYLKKN